mmetsp:Transcript_360/g.2806  ORF Transcript_360/g.2806 Transcript_360/m.2806 type:complete len:418 (-) Transcript_360:1-1254(-)
MIDPASCLLLAWGRQRVGGAHSQPQPRSRRSTDGIALVVNASSFPGGDDDGGRRVGTRTCDDGPAHGGLSPGGVSRTGRCGRVSRWGRSQPAIGRVQRFGCFPPLIPHWRSGGRAGYREGLVCSHFRFPRGCGVTTGEIVGVSRLCISVPSFVPHTVLPGGHGCATHGLRFGARCACLCFPRLREPVLSLFHVACRSPLAWEVGHARLSFCTSTVHVFGLGRALGVLRHACVLFAGLCGGFQPCDEARLSSDTFVLRIDFVRSVGVRLAFFVRRHAQQQSAHLGCVSATAVQGVERRAFVSRGRHNVWYSRVRRARGQHLSFHARQASFPSLFFFSYHRPFTWMAVGRVSFRSVSFVDAWRSFLPRFPSFHAPCAPPIASPTSRSASPIPPVRPRPRPSSSTVVRCWCDGPIVLPTS